MSSTTDINISDAIPVSVPTDIQPVALAPVTPVEIKPEIEEDKVIVKSSNALKVEFLDKCVRVDLGKGFTKLVEYDDFYDSLNGWMAKRNVEKKQGELVFSLPSNTIWMAFSETSIKLVCYYPGGVRDVNYQEEILPRVVPNIIITHVLTRTAKKTSSLTTTHYFATDLSLSALPREWYSGVSYAKRIFLLPFSNMYDSGAMCTGANQLPKNFEKDDVRALHAHYEMIFNSPFNTDLGVKAASNYEYRVSPTAWFSFLAQIAKQPNPQFPYHELTGYVRPI